ncbi:MAG: hypothetical protein Kow006_12510 [Gammaproteobacteria bacterium]
MGENEKPVGKSGGGTIEFLIRRMQHKPDFPAMSQHVAEINRMAADGGDWSANALANVVLNDYSLTTKLLRLVNSPLFGQYGREISTVSRAIVVLGFKQVRLAALSLLLFEHLQGGEEADALREAAVASLLSGLLAHRLAGRISLDEPEEAFVCAMFHSLGKHLAIYYFPEEYRVVCRRVEHQGELESEAARRVLGVSYADLGAGVARYWGFPASLTQSMAALPPGRLPPATSRDARLHQLAGYSNELCQVFSALEGEQRETALKAVRDRFSRSIAVDEEAMHALMESALEDISEHAESLRLPTRGSPLLARVRRWRETRGEEAGEALAPEAGREEGAGVGDADDPVAALTAGVQEVTDAMLEECPVNELLSMVLEIFYRSLRPTRVLFFVLDPKSRQMAVRSGFGKGVERLIGSLRFDVGTEADIFSRALQRGEDVAVADVRAAEVKGAIPGWLNESLPTRSLQIYPLVVRNNPLGLILIDWEAPNRTLPPQLDRLAKTLRNQAVLSVKQQGKR